QRDRHASDAACNAARRLGTRRFRANVASTGFQDSFRRDRRQLQANLAQSFGNWSTFREGLPFLSSNRAWIEQRRYGHGGVGIKTEYAAAGHEHQPAPPGQIGGFVGQERGNQFGVRE